MFPTKQLFHFKSENNRLPYEAFVSAHQEAVELDKDLAALLQKRIGQWGDESSSWSKWTTPKYVYNGIEYSGALTVRISKLYKRMYERPINMDILSKIGSTLGQFKKEIDLVWTIDNIFHWEPGDFAERDRKSCWWSGNNYCRVGLAARPESRVVLFYESEEQYEKFGGKKGIGRSWLIEQGDKDRALIFNAYGISLSDTASALASQFKMKSKKVRIYSEAAFLNQGNLNNMQREGGETGLGYVIAKAVDEYSSTSTLEIPNFSSSYAHCHHCKEKYRPERLHIKGYQILCAECLDKLYPKCMACGKPMDQHEVIPIVYSGTMKQICKPCYDKRGLGAPDHFCEIHGNTFDNCYKAWHTGKQYCYTCLDNDLITQCSTCKKFVNDFVKLEIGGRKYSLCIPCSRKLVEGIRYAPRLGHRNAVKE